MALHDKDMQFVTVHVLDYLDHIPCLFQIAWIFWETPLLHYKIYG